MRLIDAVAQARYPVLVDHPSLGRLVLPGTPSLVEAVRRTPLRYVLLDNSTAACSEIVYRQPDLLCSSVDLLRVPGESVWVEWSETIVRREIGYAPSDVTRIGVLVEADDQGRRGTIRSFWLRPGTEPDLSPAVIGFDLDRDPVLPPPPGCHRLSSVDIEALNPLLTRCWGFVDADWMGYYREAAGDGAQLTAALNALYQSVWTSMPIFSAFCLLLTMKEGVEHRPSDLAKLNVVRAKKGRPLLLDHVEVSTRIFRDPRFEEHAGSGRAPSRLHFVRGHFFRRGSGIHWRNGHLRGDKRLGLPATRTVRVSLGRSTLPPPEHLRTTLQELVGP